MAKLGLDVHNRGVLTVCKQLRDAGMEVIYIGNSFPDEIIRTAFQECVDVIGVSSLAGSHLTLGAELASIMPLDVVLAIGGVFSPEDEYKLKVMGYDCVFTPGASGKEIVDSLKECVVIKGEFYGGRCF